MELRTRTINEKLENNAKANEVDADKAIKDLDRIKSSAKNNIHQGHRARLKSQFIEGGLNNFTDIQKLELLLYFAIPQKDTNPIAHNLLNHFGSLKNVVQANYLELMKVDGVKENTALLITLVNSYIRHCYKPEELNVINSTESALEYAVNLFKGSDVEEFYVICLTKSGLVKKTVFINRGTADEVGVEIRTITQAAIEQKVNKIIICHNHPNGEASMSDEDVHFTYSVICSCMLNSIELVDHIVVANNSGFSLNEASAINKLELKAIDALKLPKERELFLSDISKEYIRSKVVDFEFPKDF